MEDSYTRHHPQRPRSILSWTDILLVTIPHLPGPSRTDGSVGGRGSVGVTHSDVAKLAGNCNHHVTSLELISVFDTIPPVEVVDDLSRDLVTLLAVQQS